MIVVVGCRTRKGRKGARKAGCKKALRPPQELLQGAVATRAVGNSALGLSRRTTRLELMAVEFLAAEVLEFLPRAPADVAIPPRGMWSS